MSGVGSSVKDLFKGHKSTPRQTREIYLFPLKTADIKAFFLEAQTLLNIQFEENVVETIVSESDGFPYAIHLVALEACRAARRSGSPNYITFHHLDIGRDRAIRYAYHDHLDKFSDKVATLNLTDILLLQYINCVRGRNISLEDLKGVVFEDIKEGATQLTEDDFEFSWESITSRCGILRPHPSRNDLYIFTDPLMKPFLRMQYRLPPKRKRKTKDKNHDPNQPTLDL